MFKTVNPVLAVIDMAESIRFWQRLGFQVTFFDRDSAELSDYAGVARENIEFHLQTFTPEQRGSNKAISVRVQMEDLDCLKVLYEEWLPLEIISARLDEKPWGTVEFGFYAPCGTAFFFYVDR
ncbi:hypothetical protein [Parvularcula sp. IMCC14364]|uniref:hypothetical protein n=1 Tax=Parvularcula sp. IMCC14364 TaxID=3067902 RepID=UPI002740641A|nr:hypothetical protein [Parvularcula sp. IMCC14364]